MTSDSSDNIRYNSAMAANPISLLVLNQVSDSSIAILLDVLHTANSIVTEEKYVPTSIVSPIRRRVLTARGMSIAVDQVLDNRFETSTLVIPGIDFFTETEPVNSGFIDAFVRRPNVKNTVSWLAEAQTTHSTIAAGCTGTILLAEAGLLNGRTATTTWWLRAAFSERYPEVELRDDLSLVRDCNILCAGAVLAHTQLALYIVGLRFGASVRDKVARRMIIDEASRQATFINYSEMVRLPEIVRKAEVWISENLENQFSVEDLASAVSTSPRTLARRFQDSIGRTPLQIIQHIRVQEAIRLLQQTELSFEQISRKVGYNDSAGLRRVMIRETGKRPSQFRHFSTRI